MDEKVMEYTYKLMAWIEVNFGRAGCLVFAILFITLLVLTFVILNRLPEPKQNSLPENTTEKL